MNDIQKRFQISDPDKPPKYSAGYTKPNPEKYARRMRIEAVAEARALREEYKEVWQ